ncbi:unnamed protein product, partial [Tilletia caries]
STWNHEYRSSVRAPDARRVGHSSPYEQAGSSQRRISSMLQGGRARWGGRRSMARNKGMVWHSVNLYRSPLSQFAATNSDADIQTHIRIRSIMERACSSGLGTLPHLHNSQHITGGRGGQGKRARSDKRISVRGMRG